MGELKFTIEGRGVFAYANGQTKPALTVELLADRPTGKLGLRVGNGSDGWFRNLKITPAGMIARLPMRTPRWAVIARSSRNTASVEF